MTERYNRKTVGRALIAVGVLLLMVSNNILIGWRDVWPLIAVAVGAFVLNLYRSRRAPGLLFTGITGVLLGLFLAMFSLGVFGWNQMAVLWPTIPLIAGIALLMASAVRERGGTSLIMAATIILFSVVGYMFEGGGISDRVSAPFLRFWPLVLVVAGVVILKMQTRDSAEDRIASQPTRAVQPAPPSIPLDLERRILDKVKNAALSGNAVSTLVRELKSSFSRYSWVGVYRLHGEVLTLADGDFVGPAPEYREILMTEGICGAAARQGATIIVPDVCSDDRYLACSPSVKSEIVVPVVSSGALIGVLDIDSDELNAFSDADRQFLEGLVAKAGPFLQTHHPAL